MPTFTRNPIEGIMALSPLCLTDDQEIDYDGIRSNIEYLESQGIHGFIQLSSMGQVSAPSEAEFEQLTDVCVDAADDITCVVGGSGTSQREVIDRVTYAEEAGADGTMVELPYMLPLEPDWVGPFFRDVDDALAGEIAVLVYNFPPVTDCNITPEMWREELLEIESIKALKESNMAIGHHDEVLTTVADEINFISPYDAPFWHDSQLGGAGFIGILTWTAPKVFLKFYEECRDGNHHDPWVREANRRIVRAFGEMNRLPDTPMMPYEFGVLNALAEIGGQNGGPPRLPYRSIEPEARAALEDAVAPLMELEAEL
jgi:4-hydroxy-tetrahydrodipicolinate synthase